MNQPDTSSIRLQTRGPLSGARWDRYRIGPLLGEGGMASVYRARDLRQDRVVAFKVLPAYLAESDLVRHRFAMEVRTANGINSPHVVPVYDAGNYHGMLYYTMELLTGGSLANHCADIRHGGETLPLTQVLGWMRQAALGLRAAAERGIVHRDIKPGNLLLTGQQQVKISDFGIAQMVWSDTSATPSTRGTPAYMSPEQGSGDELDSRSDLYALGCVFYELLTGPPPYHAASQDALIYQHHFAEPEPLVLLRPDLPPSVQTVVFTLLQKNPQRRYQSASECIADLDRLATDEAPIHAAPANRHGTGGTAARQRRTRRHQQAWMVFAAVLLLLLSAGLLVLRPDRPAAHSANRLRARLSVLDHSDPLPQPTPQRLAEIAVLTALLADYATLVDDNDPDLIRWRSRIAALTVQPAR